MNNQIDESSYSTKDLYEAAFLYASGKKLTNLAREGSQAWFIFENKTDCEKLTRSFWAKEGEIDAKTYSEAVRSLKDMLFAHK